MDISTLRDLLFAVSWFTLLAGISLFIESVMGAKRDNRFYLFMFKMLSGLGIALLGFTGVQVFH